MHLKYCLMTANMGGEMRHAQEVLKELGVTYQHATPQSLYDSWWFWNCQNVPDKLPKYLTELTVKPHDAIGYGLDKQTADAIEGGKEGWK